MERRQAPPSLRSVKAIVILDHDGERVVAKYYDSTFPTLRDQLNFEKKLHRRTLKEKSEVVLLDGITILYRANIDLVFYVMGSAEENELLLMAALNCLVQSVDTVLRRNLDKKSLLAGLDLVLLAVDEICDQGVLLELDSDTVVNRVGIRSDDFSLGDQAVSHVQAKIEAKMAATSAVIQSAKEQLMWSLLK